MMYIDLLREVSLFEGLSENELRALGEVAITRQYPKGNVILLAEEEGDTMYVILRGKVKISIISEDGREIILEIFQEHDFFGEMSLLDSGPRSATVIAMEDTELLMLRRPEFLDLIRRIPEIATKLLAEMTSRLRRADRKIESLALLNVTGRIAGTLLQLAEQNGESTQEGTIIRNRPTHQELANMSGTTRETVTRVLKRLERDGYIVSLGKDILILENRDLQDVIEVGL